MSKKKKKMAIYSATGCRACEHAILNIHYQVNSLTRWSDITFWPYVLGSQWQDLQDQPQTDVCLFSGAILTEADREAALRLREKSRVMVACGACAAYGGLPGLINHPLCGSVDTPQDEVREQDGAAGKTEEWSPLPRAERRVSALSQVVGVDYVIPGCPPRQNYLWAAIQSIVYETQSSLRLSFSACRLPQPMAQAITSGVLPPKGSVFSGERAVCASCSRVKEKKQFVMYTRPWQREPDPERCLLEQGYLCLGIVTREGCGGVCPAAGLPCRGCFGKTDAVLDPGVKMVSAVGSTLDSSNPDDLAATADQFVDLGGTFYRYTLARECVLLPSGGGETEGERDNI